MKYSVKVSIQPQSEPISLEEAKSHLRVDTASDDDYIERLIKSARETVEIETGRALVTQTQIMKMDCFPSGEIVIPNPPLQEISSIQYYDVNGVLQTLDSSSYEVDSDSEPGRVAPTLNSYWPSTAAKINSVIITFVAGYPPGSGSPTDYVENVPESLKQAICLLIGHYFENREDTISGSIMQLPRGVESFIWQHKIARYS